MLLVLPGDSQLLHNETERMKMTPFLVINAKVMESLLASTLSALVSCRFTGRSLNNIVFLVAFQGNMVTCKGVVCFDNGSRNICIKHIKSIYIVRDTILPAIRAPSQYPKRRLFVRSRKVSKPRDLYLELSDRSEI